MALTKVGKEGITGISNSSNATAITIDSSENVGIGETSPSSALHVKGGAGANIAIQSTAGSHWRIGDAVGAGNGTFVIYDYTNSSGRINIGSTGQLIHYADVADGAHLIQNDGNNSNRWGIRITCGADDGSGTNYAVIFRDGDGSSQGSITFSGGTVTYGAFTAHHPCIIPDSDNDESSAENAYPYGTLLETTSVSYSQKSGADTERGIRYNVQKTQSANSKAVLGAYGSSMNNGPDEETNLHQALVLGDGHILCNNSGGNIEVGDGICSSATAGIGQKATANPSMIIGIAQEDVTFSGSETKLVPVQYGLQQFIPWS